MKIKDWRENVKVNHYAVIIYTDVIGNATDGWEVNNLYRAEDDISITEDSTDKEILTYLKNIGILTTDDMRQVRLNNDYDAMIEICSVKGDYPIGRLELITDNKN